MENNALIQTEAWVIALLLFVLMIISSFIGKKIGNYIQSKRPPKEKSTETSALVALLFFLLAFTFGMSSDRYNSRRQIVVEEANDIGTAILRSDLYPDSTRTLFRKDFKDYVEARIAYFEAGANLKGILAADSLSQVISAKLWKRATDLSKDPNNLAATQQMIPALNIMIDVTSTRLAGEKSKVPQSILIMLFFLSIITAFYGGYSDGRSGRIDWLVQIGFCLLISLVMLFTLDLDRPRRGFVNLDVPNQTIIDLRKNFK
ncbi:bestrophin-like domain [Flavobacterium mesophilum]|uniref:bestrophin-like domain n=1 Tax=Flavobacterium mesophilum TaxID=3143495 RepID=UPI0031D2F611